MPKLFAPDCDLREEIITLNGANAEHLHVLRVRLGEVIMVADGSGTDARCIVESAQKDSFCLRVMERMPSAGEASVSTTIYAAIPKGDKAEMIVQKSVELGADRIAFFLSSRCISRPDDRAAANKTERLQKVAEAAAVQCGRGRIPQVLWFPKYQAMLADASGAELAAFLWEGENRLSLKALLRSRESFHTAALITGPEGGFSAEEAEQAKNAGIPSVSLGTRILRCETAPVCALTALMYETGNLE